MAAACKECGQCHLPACPPPRPANRQVLTTVGADITMEYHRDGVYRVHLGDGGYIAFGEDGDWWTAVEYPPADRDAYPHTIYAGGDLGELAAIIRKRTCASDLGL
jgi:hypothetical protein